MLQNLKSRVRQYRHANNQKVILSRLNKVYDKYAHYTMIHKRTYIDNLLLSLKAKDLPGDIVECGVWRGGMIAGIAEIIGNGRTYYLFDSFEGLPAPKEIDGIGAFNWQKDVNGEEYHDNCKAEIEFAQKAMNLSAVRYECIKGWFDKTIPGYQNINTISLLRLDGDWYDSTIVCLVHLFPKVVKGGIIIIDDYGAWDGCSRAVHDYLSKIQSASRISTSPEGVAYIIKNE